MTDAINLDDWYTVEQAVERLSQNSGGKEINRDYPRTLARYGLIKSLSIGPRARVYKKTDIDGYVVGDKAGRRAKPPVSRKCE